MQKKLIPSDSEKRSVARLLELAEKDPQIGALMPRKAVRNAACTPGLSCDKVIAVYLDGYASRPFLAERGYDVKSSAVNNRAIRVYRRNFSALTYGELHGRIKSLAMAWRTHPHCRVRRDDFVCIVGFAGIDFAVIDLACAYAKAITVPLSATSSFAELKEILGSIHPGVLACATEDLLLCVAHAVHLERCRTIIVFNHDPRVDEEVETIRKAREKLDGKGAEIRLVLLDELIEYGRHRPFSFLQEREGESEQTAMIIHSSGSTGRPKGACISARALINTLQGPVETVPIVTVIMEPFNHNMGRNELYKTLSAGGTAYFTLKPNMSTLFEDIRLARPTTLVFFPRILDLIYQHFRIEVSKRMQSCGKDRVSVEKAIMAEMRSTFLGDRLLSAAVASAPISDRVKQFIIECFDIHLVDGYSTTETASGGLAIDGRIVRDIVLDYKLRDVPDLGYFTTDRPHPRGEFCVKTRFGISHYYNQPEATAQLFDEEGYTLTGDIVEELGPDHISIIDRKFNILKLPQGEYAPLATLGKLFEGNSVLISQIFLYGNSRRSYLLAVVVPDLAVAKEMLQDNITDEHLKGAIAAELQRVARQEQLKSFEVPRDFIVAREPFSQENGLLSSVNKYLVPAFRRKYGPQLEAMFDERDTGQESAIAALKQQGCSLSTQEKVIRILEIVLRRSISEGEQLQTFYELGGDSLAAVLCSMYIDSVFGVRIEGDLILSPTGNLCQWVQLVETAPLHQADTPSFHSIHTERSEIIRSEELQLDRFVDRRVLGNASSLPDSTQPPRTVLLTGANGFLGHILCLRLLEELAGVGGRLLCLLRAADDAGARKRLDNQFTGVDAAMEDRYKGLAARHLEVVAGDIAAPQLGLGVAAFERLADRVDAIFHAGALVNHRLGYQHLFGPNVRGTAEVINLAITGRKKPIYFLSTIGVNHLVSGDNEINEDSALAASVALSDAYAKGYIASKWAGEHLLHRADEIAQIPVHIFRCDMIMPDRRYRGQFNAGDIITRLIYSIIVTGIAPGCFGHPPHGTQQSPCWRGIPADVLADIIVGAASLGGNTLTVYNAYNYWQDSFTLDTLVEWIESAGFPVHRIAGYRDWLVHMERALQQLPLQQRQPSMLSVLDALRASLPADQRMPGCAHFRRLVRQLYGERDLPTVSEAYIHEYLHALKAVLTR